MVAFRNAARGEAVTNWWDNGGDADRLRPRRQGLRGHQPRDPALSRTFQTSLPAGAYCDVQSGRTVTVDGSGRFTATLGPGTALALHTGARTGCS